MDAHARTVLARFGAPAAFLAAATVVVLLIRAALGGGDSQTATRPTAGVLPTHATTPSAPPTHRITVSPGPRTPSADAVYYTIQSGDTLGSVAVRYETTVDELIQLNPGVDPQSLRVGQRLRVS